MSVSASLKDVRTPEWAQEVMEFLDMSEEESSDIEEDEELPPAPFKIRFRSTRRRDLNLAPRELEAAENSKLRQRVYGIRRKTLLEIKTLVLSKMAEEEPNIEKQMDQGTMKAIFVQKGQVTVFHPHQFNHRYYELTDLQYNLFLTRVKDETEKDKVKVSREKEDLLREMNQIRQAEEGTIPLIS